jgi:hypothetical protein
LVIAGPIVFGVAYGLSNIVNFDEQLETHGTGVLWVPVVGPFIYSVRTGSAAYMLFGLTQVLGLGLLAVGLWDTKAWVVRDEPSQSLHAAPTSSRGFGTGASARF